jgi:hypothetical protein
MSPDPGAPPVGAPCITIARPTAATPLGRAHSDVEQILRTGIADLCIPRLLFLRRLLLLLVPNILTTPMRTFILVRFSTLTSALARVDYSSSRRCDTNCYETNDIVGTWTLTYANQTANGTTTFPFGPDPHGFLFNMAAPALTWIEEVQPTDQAESEQPAQSSAGYYNVDKNGCYLGRGIVSSTIVADVGNYSPSSVLDLIRIDENTLLEQFYPAEGVHIMAIWSKWVPGTTEYPSNC